MWLDILSVEDAKKYPVKNITPPPAEDWEVRHVYLCSIFCSIQIILFKRTVLESVVNSVVLFLCTEFFFTLCVLLIMWLRYD